MDTFQFGHTVTRLPQLAYRFGRAGANVLVLGGVHGNEPEGVIVSLGLIERFIGSFTHSLRMTIVPQFNLDGILARITGYKIVENIGYPTPGCLGTYCGLERNIPTLTYEIERGL
ncbi:MAG: hypothetical protein A2Z20_06210 [Bdellovibrionales bacterium RBG_16_40_8]|nr:MAG: hypothetical protein A2Z20_06210 [Bdellovibrionales bacterium RBG_16_40_8]